MSSPSSTPILRSQGVKLIAMLALSLTLGGCDYVASFTKPKQTPEEAKAEGIALGAGCRQAGQSLEDCYQRNPDKLKAGIFAGWKDMHEYMAAKNIQTIVPPPMPEKTEADTAKDKEAPKDDRTARRERREREKAEKDGKDGKDSKDSKDSKSKDSKSKDGGGGDSDRDRSSRRNRDRDDSGSSKK
jgi:type IV secretory pathway VirB10-like protein